MLMTTFFIWMSSFFADPVELTVAKDGTGDYTTIQEAVNAVRDLSKTRVNIYVKNGVYREKLVIPTWKIRISIIGENTDSTIITWNDYSGKPFPGKDPSGRTVFGTFTSYTMLVQGNDFRAENLTIENSAGPVGQAVALHVEGDRGVFINCRLLGNQDTLYTATNTSRQYYQNCFIEGTTDFIFGEATAVFQSCTIRSKKNSYITAASTSPGQDFGYVFLDCILEADPEAKKVYLGRPWRPHAKTVFIRTSMGAHITPEGWDNWRDPVNEKTAFYAESGGTGPGAASGKRVGWSRQLSKKALRTYTLKNIFERDGWLPDAAPQKFLPADR